VSESEQPRIEESFQHNPNVFFAEEFIDPGEYPLQIFAKDLVLGETYKVRLSDGREELRKFIHASPWSGSLSFLTVASNGLRKIDVVQPDSEQYFKKAESLPANFVSWSLEKQVERIISAGTADFILSFFSTNPAAKALLQMEPVKSFFLKDLFHRGVAEKKILWNLYADSNPFITKFTYNEEPKIMFSQKGGSCASDALFTILFECKDFAPVLEYDWAKFYGIVPTDNCCIEIPKSKILESLKSMNKYKDFYDKDYVGSSIEQYALALSSAKKRYMRMPKISKSILKSYTGELRRSISVSNDVWKDMISPINTSCMPSGEGMYFMDVSIFLDKLLVENIFKLKDLPLFEVNFFEAPPQQEIRLDTISAILVAIAPQNLIFEGGHAIGFYKNDGEWFLVDNTIGYIHKILDTDWFNTEFIPRLLNSVSDKGDTTYENLANKLLFIQDYSLNKFMLNYQILTLGARSYPNTMPPLDAITPKYVRIPRKLIIITKDSTATGMAAAGAATGMAAAGAATGMAAAGAASRGGRRQTRRHGRKTYRKRRI
jgi:hypothetical protein